MFSFYNRPASGLINVLPSAGDHIIFSNDTGELFVDHDGQRVKYSDIITVSRTSSRTN